LCYILDVYIYIYIYIYDLRVCLSSTLSSGRMQDDITHVGERPTINEP